MSENPTIAALSHDLETGRRTARELVEQCLERAGDAGRQGDVAFISIDAARIRAEADAVDADRKAGRAASRFAGIPVSIKDLFDVRGEVTGAGSKILAGQPPAGSDSARSRVFARRDSSRSVAPT